MILYDPHIPASLVEFGIQIPIRDSRAVNTFQALNDNVHLHSSRDQWYVDHIDERLTREDLLRVHTPAYVEGLFGERLEAIITETYELIDANGNYHRYDPDAATSPLTDLFGRILLKAAGTTQCARLALSHGFCYYFSGGMHHAHADHGSGFCLINDIVIAARKLQAENRVRKVWVIDTDAHKGDGTAALTVGDGSIVTLSIHMARGWPLDGVATLADGTANPAFCPSDIDLPIEKGDDRRYLKHLEQGLDRILALGPADLAMVVSGGDPYEKDQLPSTAGLQLSLAQLMARDRLIYEFLTKHHIPAAFLMAGGYGDEVWRVFAQFLTWVLVERGFGG